MNLKWTTGSANGREWAWLVLVLGLFVVLLLWSGLHAQKTNFAEAQFELRAQEVVHAIERRLRHHEQILLGGAGLFDISDNLSREQWRTYVERLRLKGNYPGILGVGYSQVVYPDQMADHVASVRAEGFPEYSVKPAGERPIYTSIVYLEPFMGRNLAAFGYDMFSEKTRHEAMQQAVDDKRTTISGKVRLVQETHGKEQAGFLMYVPIYRPNLPLTTEKERWSALRGFVYSPYRVDDLMEGILGESQQAIHFTIHDGESVSPQGLMYTSVDESSEGEQAHSQYSLRLHIHGYGHAWTITLFSRPDFDARFSTLLDWLVPMLGLGIVLSLFALTWSLQGRRQKAMALAEEMVNKRQESEERFRQLFLHMGQGVIMMQADGVISDSNPAAEGILGLRQEQIRGITPMDPHWRTIREDGSDFPSEAYPIMLALRRGKEVKGVVMGVWHVAEGAWRWIQVDAYPQRSKVSGEVEQVYAVFSDITDAKKGQSELEEQVQHTQAILDNVLDGIITIDGRGSVASFNKAAETIFGYAAKEVIGRNIKMLMPEPYRGQHDGYLTAYHATKVRHIIGIGHEVEGLRKDGGQFPLDLAVTEIRHKGEVMFIGVVRDISERKRVELMKNEFVSTVSHELRTPLTSIAGALGLLAGGAVGEMPEQMRGLLDIAQKNSKRLTHLINDLLDIEKIAAGKMRFEMKPKKLKPLLEQALAMNKAYGDEYGVRFQLHNDHADDEICVDSQRLMQVMANFLSNAAKFSPRGSDVEVTSHRVGSRVRIEVRDHGPGVPDDFRERIFQKFSQADASDTRQKGGTGLGLAISKELVERMGGTIGFESLKGQGAIFFAEFPLYGELAPDERRQRPASASGAHRLLVVEDEPDVAMLLAGMLQHAGYQADIAVNGKQAMLMLERQPYDAVTLDLILPDMSGLEIIHWARARTATRNLPFIVVSARMEEGRLSIEGEMTQVEWLPKMVSERELVAAIEHFLPPPVTGRLRVLHVEDDTDLHQVVRAMAGEAFEFELATSLAQAESMLAMERFDLVLLDLELPDGLGWDLLPQLKQLQPPPRVMILSGTELSPEQAEQVESSLLKTHFSSRDLLDALSARIDRST